jgi:hypothetical protein
MAKSLEGNWRQELIFVLQQEIEMYDTYQRRVAECDQELQKHLSAFADTVSLPVKEELPLKKKKEQNKNNPHFHLADELQPITGVDLTRIDGVDVMVAQTLVSEVGLAMSRWKTESHFASWDFAQTTESAETKCLHEVLATCSIVRPRHFVWGPQPCCEARRTSARSTADCAASSAPRKPSPRWLTGSLDSSIEC